MGDFFQIIRQKSVRKASGIRQAIRRETGRQGMCLAQILIDIRSEGMSTLNRSFHKQREQQGAEMASSGYR
jgi:hypothetical protein